jgi:UDP:flavonoid glycosyltransferase YjiC (YdhE family)
MKVLFMPIPGLAHAFPMVPLAWAMAAAGHEVTYLGGLGAAEVRNAGIPVIDPIPGVSMEELFPQFQQQMPVVFESMDHLTNEQILGLKPMLVAPWDYFADVYVEAAKTVKPDLIIYDPVFNAGLVAASVLDVPAIGHGYMLVRFGPEVSRQGAAGAFERHGVELPKRQAMIEIGPPSLMEAGSSRWQMRYIPFNGGGILPPWLAERPERPRIAVTLGTALPHRQGIERYTSILNAVREVDAEFALTVTAEKAAEFGPLPENVRITGWIPLYRLLQTCTALIHHGGSGTMFSACAAGVPQLIVPEGADNDYNARILRDYGCGLACSPGHVDTASIERLATDPALRTAARELQREVELMRPPSALVDEIVEFAR